MYGSMDEWMYCVCVCVCVCVSGGADRVPRRGGLRPARVASPAGGQSPLPVPACMLHVCPCLFGYECVALAMTAALAPYSSSTWPIVQLIVVMVVGPILLNTLWFWVGIPEPNPDPHLHLNSKAKPDAYSA